MGKVVLYLSLEQFGLFIAGEETSGLFYARPRNSIEVHVPVSAISGYSEGEAHILAKENW